jgi:hypothetical protein
MTDKEKITEILKAYTKKHNISASSVILEEYAEELVRQGAILPPCKVGDKIYMLVTRKTHSFVFEKGKKMLRVDNQHTFIKETYITKLNFFKVIDDFGKTVFLTKEEAEKKLKELKGNE